MHTEAWDWIARFSTNAELRVLDIGGRFTTHDPRELFPNANYTVLDLIPDESVDIVADAATWSPRGQTWDIVIAAEVFEHTPFWRTICYTAWRALKGGGKFIVTTAAPGRPPHSAIDGQELRWGEYYGNIDPEHLYEILRQIGFKNIVIDELPSTRDVRAVATKAVTV